MSTNSPEYDRVYYKRKRRKIVELLGGRCQKCSTIFDLEIDHVNGYNGAISPNKSRGGKRNLLDAIKIIKTGRIDELRLLCTDCNKSSYWHGRR